MKPIKIAILEDLKEVAAHLQTIFNREADMTCTQLYQNAEDAMHFLVASPVDILIVDIGLPRASGIDAMKMTIRFSIRYKQVPKDIYSKALPQIRLSPLSVNYMMAALR